MRLRYLVLLVTVSVLGCKKDPSRRLVEDRSSEGCGLALAACLQEPDLPRHACREVVIRCSKKVLSEAEPDELDCMHVLEGYRRFAPYANTEAIRSKCARKPPNDPGSTLRYCLLGKLSAKCAPSARAFAHQVAAKEDPTPFDCRIALIGVRRFAPDESAKLVEACCPLRGEESRDDDGAPLCPKVTVRAWTY